MAIGGIMRKSDHNKLREFRKQKGLTQAETAELLGIRRTKYCEAEKHGNRNIWLYFSFLQMLFTLCGDKQNAFNYVELLGGADRNEYQVEL